MANRSVRKVLTLAGGGALVLLGVAMLVLPGPGLLVVLAGLVVLAREFPAVRTFVAPVRERALSAARASVSSRWRLAGSSLAAMCLVAGGVAWGLVEELPFSGWSAGVGGIFSGLCVGGLLWWSYREVSGRDAAAPAGAVGDGDGAGRGE